MLRVLRGQELAPLTEDLVPPALWDRMLCGGLRREALLRLGTCARAR